MWIGECISQEKVKNSTVIHDEQAQNETRHTQRNEVRKQVTPAVV